MPGTWKLERQPFVSAASLWSCLPPQHRLTLWSHIITASWCDPAGTPPRPMILHGSCITRASQHDPGGAPTLPKIPHHQSLMVQSCRSSTSSHDPASPEPHGAVLEDGVTLQRAFLHRVIRFCQTFSMCGSIFWETWGKHGYSYTCVTTGSKSTAWILNELNILIN